MADILARILRAQHVYVHWFQRQDFLRVRVFGGGVMMTAVLSDVVLVAVCAFGLRTDLRASAGRRVTGLLLTTFLVTLVIQALIARPRPGGGPLLIFDWPLWSYPSGHAALLAGVAVFVGVQSRGLRGATLLLGGLALIGAILRVKAGLHFPTDVVGGLALGGGFGVFFAQAGRDDRPAWSWGLAPMLGALVSLQLFALVPLGSVEKLFFAGADKPLHFIAFGTVGFFAAGWSHRPIRMLLVLSSLACLEELSQGLQPNRTVDHWDAAMSLLGLLGLGGLGAVLRWRSSPSRDSVATVHL